jgi:hypothetical protein
MCRHQGPGNGAGTRIRVVVRTHERLRSGPTTKDVDVHAFEQPDQLAGRIRGLPGGPAAVTQDDLVVCDPWMYRARASATCPPSRRTNSPPS